MRIATGAVERDPARWWQGAGELIQTAKLRLDGDKRHSAGRSRRRGVPGYKGAHACRAVANIRWHNCGGVWPSR